MKLYVRSVSGGKIPVNEETIIGFSDSMDYIISKRDIINGQIVDLDNKIDKLKKKMEKSET